MGKAFFVQSLTENQLSQAYPLIQAVAPKLALQDWLAYGRSLCASNPARPGGVAAAFGGDGYIYGVLSYWTEADLRHGPTLIVDNMVALDLIDRNGVIDALIGASDRIARQHGCNFVHVILSPARDGAGEYGDSLIAPLRRAGHEVDGVRLCRHIGHAQQRH